MNYITCIIVSVLISTTITFYLLKVFVSKMIETFEDIDESNRKFVREMNEITVDGILEILKKATQQ